jgi:hypothetical protein
MTVKLINNFKTFNDMSRPKWLDKRRGKLNLRRQIGVTFLGSAREGGQTNENAICWLSQVTTPRVCKTFRGRATSGQFKRPVPSSLNYSFTINLHFSMKQSPSWEANRRPAGQEIPRLLWCPKFHCRVHKTLPPVPNQSHMSPAHNRRP